MEKHATGDSRIIPIRGANRQPYTCTSPNSSMEKENVARIRTARTRSTETGNDTLKWVAPLLLNGVRQNV